MTQNLAIGIGRTYLWIVTCSQTWTLAGEHWVVAELSRLTNSSISSREQDVGSARNKAPDSEAFATASSAAEAIATTLLAQISWDFDLSHGGEALSQTSQDRRAPLSSWLSKLLMWGTLVRFSVDEEELQVACAFVPRFKFQTCNYLNEVWRRPAESALACQGIKAGHGA